MLLRSTSTPILQSFIQVSKEILIHSSPSSSSSSSPSIAIRNNSATLTRALSSDHLWPKCRPNKHDVLPSHTSMSISLEEENNYYNSQYNESKNLLPNMSNLMDVNGCCCMPHANIDTTMPVVDDEGCVGDGNCNNHGGSCRGHGGNGGGCSDSYNNDTDAYYQGMIQANPENSLVLSNYAKYLKEVRGDVDKAQEYIERAIVADQQDGDALSMYAEILWEKNKDSERAENYFDRAIQAAPNDCYVMASYARFLWDAEEEDEKESKNDSTNMNTLSFFSGITAPS